MPMRPPEMTSGMFFDRRDVGNGFGARKTGAIRKILEKHTRRLFL
jgi:hypothetical protein